MVGWALFIKLLCILPPDFVMSKFCQIEFKKFALKFDLRIDSTVAVAPVKFTGLR